MEWIFLKKWSPYVAGAGIGLLIGISFLLSDRPIGCSTAYARTSGMIERFFRGAVVEGKPYYKQFPPVIDWEWMLVAGAVLGGFMSAVLSGDFRIEWTPARWSETFGPSSLWRWFTAVIGGILVGFGARWAGGCTSGHGISGTAQMAVSSWLAVVCFFVGGIVSAMFIYRVLA
jgi:uncharacterized membrane protein YedE/YeeE